MEETEKQICAYCRESIEPNDLEMARIYSPNWRRQGGQSPPRPYHKSKSCHGYDQMSHEG
jgi:hypothetical protein